MAHEREVHRTLTEGLGAASAQAVEVETVADDDLLF
jgi:hypothetical protein